MIDLFEKTGVADHGGMNTAPISYLELEAFARIEGNVTPDELKTLRAMSVGYVTGVRLGRDVFAEAPWDGS